MQPKLIHGLTRDEHRQHVEAALFRATMDDLFRHHTATITTTCNGIRTVRVVDVPVATERRRK